MPVVQGQRFKGSGGNPQGLHSVPVVADQAPLALSNPGAFGTFLAEKYIQRSERGSSCFVQGDLFGSASEQKNGYQRLLTLQIRGMSKTFDRQDPQTFGKIEEKGDREEIKSKMELGKQIRESKGMWKR